MRLDNCQTNCRFGVTSALVFVCRLRIESLQEDSNVLVQLIPVAIHDVQDCVVLHLPLLELLDSLPQLRLGSLPQF